MKLESIDDKMPLIELPLKPPIGFVLTKSPFILNDISYAISEG